MRDSTKGSLAEQVAYELRKRAGSTGGAPTPEGPSLETGVGQSVIHLTEEEASDAAEVYRVALRHEDPYALTRAIEYVMRGRIHKTRGPVDGPMQITKDGISEPAT